MLNDLRVYERHARLQRGHRRAATWENA